VLRAVDGVVTVPAARALGEVSSVYLSSGDLGDLMRHVGGAHRRRKTMSDLASHGSG